MNLFRPDYNTTFQPAELKDSDSSVQARPPDCPKFAVRSNESKARQELFKLVRQADERGAFAQYLANLPQKAAQPLTVTQAFLSRGHA